MSPVRVTPRAHRAKWVQAETEHDGPAPSFDEVIARSSIGAGLRDIKERGIDAHLATYFPRRGRRR